MNCKNVVICFSVVCIIALLVLSGCGGEPEQPQRTSAASQREPQTYREVMQETERQMEQHAEEMDVKPEGTGTGGKRCVVMQQCDAGDDLCWFGRCWTEEQLFEDYEKCQNMKCDHLECPECDSGHERCIMATAAGAGMYQICVDCFKGEGCKPGFECKMGRCV